MICKIDEKHYTSVRLATYGATAVYAWLCPKTTVVTGILIVVWV